METCKLSKEEQLSINDKTMLYMSEQQELIAKIRQKIKTATKQEWNDKYFTTLIRAYVLDIERLSAKIKENNEKLY